MRRREAPIKRVNPSGELVWVARYTGRDGRRQIAKPIWNDGKGTFDRKREAQQAIDEAYERSDRAETVGQFFTSWTDRFPRSDRTNSTNEHRIGRVLDVPLEGVALRDWPFRDLRRRHALVLVDHLLRVQGRATTGVRGILQALSAMAEDAITDEVAEVNPFKGLRVRGNDPRALKAPRVQRVFSFAEMHAFAKAAGRWEPMIRVFTDTGMRLGEVLPLRRVDLDGVMFRVRRTAHEGTVLEGTKTDHGAESPGRVVPCPPGLAVLIEAVPSRIDTDLLFPSPTGKLWRERNFYRDVWYPAQRASGIDIRPHECRHSYVSHLRAAGVNDADLAEIAGHRIETMISRYTHPLRRSFGQIQELIG